MILATTTEQQYQQLEWAGAPSGFGALAALVVFGAAVYLVISLWMA